MTYRLRISGTDESLDVTLEQWRRLHDGDTVVVCESEPTEVDFTCMDVVKETCEIVQCAFKLKVWYQGRSLVDKELECIGGDLEKWVGYRKIRRKEAVKLPPRSLKERRSMSQIEMFPEHAWLPMKDAPKGQEVRLLFADRSERVGHWACDLSGEEQPPFKGWLYGLLPV